MPFFYLLFLSSSFYKIPNWRLHQAVFRWHCWSKGSINLWGAISVYVIELVSLQYFILSLLYFLIL